MAKLTTFVKFLGRAPVEVQCTRIHWSTWWLILFEEGRILSIDEKDGWWLSIHHQGAQGRPLGCNDEISKTPSWCPWNVPYPLTRIWNIGLAGYPCDSYLYHWVGNMMDSNTTVTLWGIRNPGSYLLTHYDGPYHRGVAQLTLDDTGRIHFRDYCVRHTYW